LELKSPWGLNPGWGLKYPSVGQHDFHRNTKTSDRLIAKGRPKSVPGQAAGRPGALVPLRASGPGQGLESVHGLKLDRNLKPVLELKHPSVTRNGFTLVEIIVALCIVAILTAIAVPGFRKATEDFRLNEFACNFDSLIKACRNYYLIFNEWPGDTSRGYIPPGNICYFLPNHLYKGSQLLYSPFKKGGTTQFDFDNYMDNGTMSIKARELGTYFQLAGEKLQSLSDHKNHFVQEGSTITYYFPDVPKPTSENRYY
jgi:prepilin-type N-terminal cleavage/methylation domain-containing protein